MELKVNYKNSPRSPWVESFLRSNLAVIEPIEARLNAVADISKQPDGTDMVHLHVDNPKSYRTSVHGADGNLYGAMNQAVAKLRRQLLKTKGKLRDRQRRPQKGFFSEFSHAAIDDPYESEIQPDNLIILEEQKAIRLQQ